MLGQSQNLGLSRIYEELMICLLLQAIIEEAINKMLKPYKHIWIWKQRRQSVTPVSFA
jgi:hypothetical protein